jgi:hypothetical protein
MRNASHNAETSGGEFHEHQPGHGSRHSQGSNYVFALLCSFIVVFLLLQFGAPGGSGSHLQPLRNLRYGHGRLVHFLMTLVTLG